MSARESLRDDPAQVHSVAQELRDILSKAKALASVTGRLQRYTETIGPGLYVDTQVTPPPLGSGDIFDIVNRLQERLKVVDDISIRLGAVESSSQKGAKSTTPASSPTMSTYVEPFFGWRAEIGTRHQVIGQERGTLARFIELHGDKPVNQYVRKDVVNFLDMLRKLPKAYGKSQKDKETSLEEFLRRAEKSGDGGLQDKTVKRHLSVLSQFFRFCVDKGGLSIAQRNELCEKHRFKVSELADNEQREAWMMSDLKILFASEVWQPDHPRDSKFWLPLMALYLGARLEELADLSRGDVFFEKISGLNAIRIIPYVDSDGRSRTLKTKASKRTIPLHPELIKLGFLVYVDRVAKSPLAPIFPDLAPQGQDGRRGPRLTRWFVEYRRKLGIYREGVAMHSFRHTVRTALGNQIVTELQKRSLDYLTGHAAQGSEGSVRYDKGPGLKLVYDTLSLLSYPELNFRHLHI
jgi:integrase